MNANLPSSLLSILDDVSRCIEAKLYYPALVVTLTLPEICVGLTKAKDNHVHAKDYIAFVDKYTTPRDLGVEGEDCYRIRGGIIHRGSATGHNNFKGTHLIFAVPESMIAIHAIGLDYDKNKYFAVCIDLVEFCKTMNSAVYQWYQDYCNDAEVASRFSSLVSWRTNGLPPFLIGTPVVGSGDEFPDLEPMFKFVP